jgi:hypothetical protein
MIAGAKIANFLSAIEHFKPHDNDGIINKLQCVGYGHSSLRTRSFYEKGITE